MDRVLSPAELAERYGVSEATLTGWRYKGTGPRFFHAGKRVFYREKDVAAWEAERVENVHKARVTRRVRGVNMRP